MVKSIKRKEIGLIPFYTQYEKVQQTVHHSSQYFFKTILQTCFVATVILQYFFEKSKEETILVFNYKLANNCDVVSGSEKEMPFKH
jgi:hypothetical protein